LLAAALEPPRRLTIEMSGARADE